jgi:signal transduction histidine kinase
VDDFSAFARWPEPKKERSDLNGLVERAAGALSLEGAGPRVEIEAGEDLPAVDADPGQIAQLLTNLLRNAADAAGETGAVRVRTRRADRGVAVEIADDGPGMSAEVLARAREPYFTSKPHGTGLGLAIAQQIVDAHGGTMEIASAEGAGTTVVVTLPPSAPVAVTSPET